VSYIYTRSTVGEHSADPLKTIMYVIVELIDNSKAAQQANKCNTPVELRYHFNCEGTLTAISVLDRGKSMDLEELKIALTGFLSVTERAGHNNTSNRTSNSSNSSGSSSSFDRKLYKTFANGLLSRYGIGLQACSRYYGTLQLAKSCMHTSVF
jgi:Histidine kinase-, DNA gyrase B-, and HSP90-like ATPase